MARKALGPQANVLAPAPEDPVRAVLDEMLMEFERVQLLLRLSGRLARKAQRLGLAEIGIPKPEIRIKPQ